MLNNVKGDQYIRTHCKRWYAKYPDASCLLLMLLAVVIVLWPISFYVAGLKWDKIDTSLPWLSLLSDIHSSGKFPYWNPYQEMGYPLYGDLQNPIWNPVFFLFLKVVNFNYAWFHFMEILIYWGASSGMYYLLRYFGLNRKTAVVFALSYGLSGFMIGRGQNLISNLGGLWMPFALLHILSFFKKPSLKTAFYMAVFVSLQVSGGYQALTIILMYFVVILSISYFIRWWKDRLFPVQNFLKYGFIAIVITLLLSGMTLYAFFDVYPFIDRSEGVIDKKILFGAFPINSLENFIIPSYTMGSNEFFTSDWSFRNLYFGIIGLVFFLFGVLHFKKMNFQIKFLFFFGLLCFVIGMGDFTPLRLWIAHNLPLMDTFRFPFFFTWFFITPVIVIAAKGLHYFKIRKSISPYFWFVLGVVFLSLLVVTLNHFFKVGWPSFLGFDWSLQYWDVFIQNLNRNQLGLVHGLFQLSIVIISMTLLFVFGKKFVKLLPFIVVLDLAIMVLFCGPFTYFSTGTSPQAYQAAMLNSPDGFPVPDLIRMDTLEKRSYKVVRKTGVWRNYSNFSRTPINRGYTSFSLKKLEQIESKNSIVFDSTMTNPVVFWADSVTNTGDPTLFRPSHKKHVFALTEKKYNRIEPGVIQLEKFDPTGFEAKVKTEEKNVLVFQQTNFKRWRAFINGQSTAIREVNGFMIGVEVPKGSHVVELRFYSGMLIPMFYLNNVIWFLTFIILMILEWKKFKKIKKIKNWDF